jgi:late competence protein required for DNA uptake (superfamily II DNA/RNA helicase)
VETLIQDIIINKKSNAKTLLIRVNSKRIIDRVMQMFKLSLKDRIACIYSDEDNVLFEGQNEEKIKELKKGKISELDIILCTSVYDVGISFEV